MADMGNGKEGVYDLPLLKRDKYWCEEDEESEAMNNNGVQKGDYELILE